MKILAINGSPNRVGSTAKLVDMLLEVCTEAGGKCEKVNLEDYIINCRRECSECTEPGGCYLEEDYLQLKAKMLDADGIIIGSPYYGGKPTMQVRMFMDRLALSDSYRKPFANKYIVGVSVSAVNDCKNVARYCANLGVIGIVGNGMVSGLLHEAVVTPEGVKDIASDSAVKEKREPVSHKMKRVMLPRWLSFVVIKLLRLAGRISDKVRKYCEKKGWIKNIKME
jgi:multimeric flavodoxin WrbA